MSLPAHTYILIHTNTPPPLSPTFPVSSSSHRYFFFRFSLSRPSNLQCSFVILLVLLAIPSLVFFTIFHTHIPRHQPHFEQTIVHYGHGFYVVLQFPTGIGSLMRNGSMSDIEEKSKSKQARPKGIHKNTLAWASKTGVKIHARGLVRYWGSQERSRNEKSWTTGREWANRQWQCRLCAILFVHPPRPHLFSLSLPLSSHFVPVSLFLCPISLSCLVALGQLLELNNFRTYPYLRT